MPAASRIATWFALSMLGAATALGCAQVVGLDDLVADLGESVAASGATGASSGTGSGGGCVSTCGTPGCGECPTSATVAIDAAAGNYQIDRYETTFDEYDAWMATAPSLVGQRPECAWNDSFQPGVPAFDALVAAKEEGMFSDEQIDVTGGNCNAPSWMPDYIAMGQGDRPVTCVDWCDAVAYCAWAGKHLCGRTGGGGTYELKYPPDDDASDDPEQSEWYRACSNAGTRLYPYGDTYEPARCNDENGTPKAVTEYPDCEGGYTDLFHMSGNVSEWDDACSESGGTMLVQNCLIRGGSYYQGDTPEALTCTEHRPVLRIGPSDTTGFRCCSGP